MDSRNIKSKDYGSMEDDDALGVQMGMEDQEDDAASEDDRALDVRMGKKGQKNDVVTKIFSRTRFVITGRQEGIGGRVTYTLQRIEYAEDSVDQVQLAGKPFQIDDEDNNYYLSPFRIHWGYIVPVERDDEEMSEGELLSSKKVAKEKSKEEPVGEKMEISIPKSGPSASPAAQPVVALVVSGKVQSLSYSQDNSLIWACHCANTLDVLASLRSAVKKQRRDSDIDGWVALQGGLAKKDFADVAILITTDTKTTYSYEKHIIYIKNTKNQYDLLHQVVFELCNAAHRTHWERLDAAAKTGMIGCIAYVYAKEALELLTEQEHDEALNSILEAGKEVERGRDRDARRNWPIKTPLKLTEYYCNPDNSTTLERLKMQISKRHAEGYIGQWTAEFLTPYMRKNSAAKAAYQQWLEKSGKPVDEASEVAALGIPGLAVKASELQLVTKEVAKFGGHILIGISKIK